MRSIAIVGSGQSGLIAAHAFLRDGHRVTVYSDRSARGWHDEGRPTGTAVRFATSLAWERELGLADGHDQAPTMEGLRVTICSHPAKPLFTLSGRFSTSPLAIDTRLQSARWLDRLQERGGEVVIGRVETADLDRIAGRHDLIFAATGKEANAWFARDAARSPAERPLRAIAMVNCDGPSMRFADVPFTSAKFNVLEGIGECYWTPYWHQDGRAVWNLVFEGVPGGPFDRFSGCRDGNEVLSACKELVRDHLPWDAAWLSSARLSDPQSWLTGGITPTVRDPIGRTPGGRLLLPLGDAYLSFDPLGAQGANMGNRLSAWLAAALRAAPDGELSEGAWRATYDGFYERYGGPSMRWTQLLLSPMTPAARYLFLAQLGADGVSGERADKQALADAFTNNFDDPATLYPTLSELRHARGFVGRSMGRRADWEALKGLATVARRQVANALSSPGAR